MTDSMKYNLPTSIPSRSIERGNQRKFMMKMCSLVRQNYFLSVMVFVKYCQKNILRTGRKTFAGVFFESLNTYDQKTKKFLTNHQSVLSKTSQIYQKSGSLKKIFLPFILWFGLKNRRWRWKRDKHRKHR